MSVSRLIFGVCLAFAFAAACDGAADEKPPAPGEQQHLQAQQQEEDLRRQAAIAEFTRKTREANYPALFEQAAAEFNVPADVLKGVAFAETRWENLTWPPGETASPETGMPRPFGIMSLRDDKYFGHSLIDAAKLIGKDPEEVKSDPLQNIRAAAALLRKIYNETPRADGSTEAEIESWHYAIRVYCGIPEPDLNAQHALDVYVFMSRGYHQYGIEWDARPVNLDPLRAETRQIVREEKMKREARMNGNTNLQNSLTQASMTATAVPQATTAAPKPKLEMPGRQIAAATPTSPEPASTQTNRRPWRLLIVFMIVFIIGAAAAFVLYRR